MIGRAGRTPGTRNGWDLGRGAAEGALRYTVGLGQGQGAGSAYYSLTGLRRLDTNTLSAVPDARWNRSSLLKLSQLVFGPGEVINRAWCNGNGVSAWGLSSRFIRAISAWGASGALLLFSRWLPVALQTCSVWSGRRQSQQRTTVRAPVSAACDAQAEAAMRVPVVNHSVSEAAPWTIHSGA